MNHPLAFLEGSFFSMFQTNPVWYFSVVFSVVISIVLHELGHGFAAIWQGDNTPREAGHITWDPMVHMGGMAIAALVFFGIAWGAMPVNPSRFRGRYGAALVAFAGPAVNLVLAFLGLTVLALWLRMSGSQPPTSSVGANFAQFLFLFGAFNIVLFLLNLLPIPPLDGASVLSDLSPDFKRFTANPDNQPFFLGGLILVFFLFGKYLFPFAFAVSAKYIALFGAVGP